MERSEKLNINMITHAANNEVPVFGSFGEIQIALLIFQTKEQTGSWRLTDYQQIQEWFLHVNLHAQKKNIDKQLNPAKIACFL